MKKILLAFVSIIVSLVISVMSISYMDSLKEMIQDIVDNDLESMVQDSVDSALGDLESELPNDTEPKTYKISGGYCFNSGINEFEGTLELSFVCDGDSYDSIYMSDSDEPDLVYANSDTGVNEAFAYFERGEEPSVLFEKDRHRFLNFGEEEQKVSAEVYEYLCDNGCFGRFEQNVYIFNDTLEIPTEFTSVDVGGRRCYVEDNKFYISGYDSYYDFSTNQWVGGKNNLYPYCTDGECTGCDNCFVPYVFIDWIDANGSVK